jgi:glycosyltransferase involved in cell wall biosynthesis
VIITKTQGFWDFENFIDNKNICFTRDNSLEEWEKKINYFLKSSSDEYSTFSSYCEKIVKEKYSMDNINKRLENFIKNL